MNLALRLDIEIRDPESGDGYDMIFAVPNGSVVSLIYGGISCAVGVMVL